MLPEMTDRGGEGEKRGQSANFTVIESLTFASTWPRISVHCSMPVANRRRRLHYLRCTPVMYGTSCRPSSGVSKMSYLGWLPYLGPAQRHVVLGIRPCHVGLEIAVHLTKSGNTHGCTCKGMYKGGRPSLPRDSKVLPLITCRSHHGLIYARANISCLQNKHANSNDNVYCDHGDRKDYLRHSTALHCHTASRCKCDSVYYQLRPSHSHTTRCHYCQLFHYHCEKKYSRNNLSG